MSADGHAGVGSAAEEAARLLEELGAWAGKHTGHSPLGGLPRLDGPECRVCPVCQLLAAVRTVRPEVLDHLAVATTALRAAVRELVGHDADGSSRSPDVETIPVTDEDAEDDHEESAG